MIRNYLKVAYRNLLRNKAHTFINMAGLSVGLTCSLLILLWVQSELSVDAYHLNGSRLYKVYEREYYDHKIDGNYDTPALMARELKKVLPAIQYATSMQDENDIHTFRVGNKLLKMEGTYADADLFKMFSYPLLQGTPQTALSSPVSIAISKNMAGRFFGDPETAMGKTIRLDNEKDFMVSAVFEQPANTSRKFEYIINWDAYLAKYPGAKTFTNTGPLTYVMLKPGADAAQVDKQLTHFIDNYAKRRGSYYFENGLQPYRQVYLHSNFTNGKVDGGRIEYVNLFSIIAVFVLLIACINFMNLTTAQSVKRAREIGVRKVMGAVRSVLIRQFIGESLLLTVLSVILSLVLMSLLLPVFNSITQKQIIIPFNQYSFWLKLGGLTLITGFVAGSYPALFLSSFNPVKVLKGTMKLGVSSIWFRKGLVVFQFVLSGILIIATIIVSKQVKYIQQKNLGYDRENLVYIPIEGELNGKYDVFRNSALNMPGIKAVSETSNNPTLIDNSTIGVDWERKDPNNTIAFSTVGVGYDFIQTMKLKLLSGRDFSKDFPSDSASYIINEVARQKLGYTDPIGRPLTMWGQKGKIVGLLKDFHFQSLHKEILPLIIRLDRGAGLDGGYILVRTQPGKTKEALASLGALCKQLNPEFPFTYYFSDEQYQELYESEQVVGKLSNIFAFLAVFISCLGLLGLAIFTAEQRVKEIGIRKVLGASVSSLFALLSSEFIVLVVIALVIASPIAWYGMHVWLQGFAYRTSIEWWVFGLSGGLTVIIALATISFQAIKAALINPIKSLRSE
ncbi:ABC transporter permease [Mucilaginibacter sp. X5P1]|uniref:ABC transporter permease n=1 Tax=Mucilaginibacter sp. X5P1 TaxID=2723088 RepID=UPI001613286C|nr:ABC transporter permease [Mucilaginibacter sp. X5P1]MBB6138420.1 ABC-type antimicrobial peptide transport system permease subunit [Mucilaginibacter sp. X5P1]